MHDLRCGVSRALTTTVIIPFTILEDAEANKSTSHNWAEHTYRRSWRTENLQPPIHHLDLVRSSHLPCPAELMINVKPSKLHNNATASLVNSTVFSKPQSFLL